MFRLTENKKNGQGIRLVDCQVLILSSQKQSKHPIQEIKLHIKPPFLDYRM